MNQAPIPPHPTFLEERENRRKPVSANCRAANRWFMVPELDPRSRKNTLAGMNSTQSSFQVSKSPDRTNSLSRRSFIGSAAAAVGAASGWLAGGTLSAGAAEQADDPTRKKDIRVGMMTAPLSGQPLDEALDMAKRCGIVALEVMATPESKLLNPMNFTQADAEATKQKLAQRGVEISSLANYMDSAAAGKTEEVQGVAKKMIDAAAQLNVPTICMITGLPREGMNRIEMLKKVVPVVFRPIVDHAKDKGIRVAVENWFATCLQGIDTFDCLLESIPDEHFGLNYDPSHLVHQELDITIPVARYSKRIFHTHAKDCLIDVPRRRYVGILGEDWWRYAIPGYGEIDWGEYIGRLRQASYRGVLSIEHEDDTFGAEEGFRHGASYLGRFC
jgi:sugar phosphate isomerase/epimerase